jgi:hypothetical protein
VGLEAVRKKVLVTEGNNVRHVADGRIEEGDDVGDSVDGATLGRMLLGGYGPIEVFTVGL